MKPTTANILNLWFGADTPIRQFKIKHNPALWMACQQIDQGFRPASQKRLTERLRKSEQVAFARAVQQELERSQVRPLFSQKPH